MDLNLLYSEHQQSLMRAVATTSHVRRTHHLASAGSVAQAIQAYQVCKGAAAANDWQRATDDAGPLDNLESRKSA